MDYVDAYIAAVQMAPGLGPLLNHELIPPLRGWAGSGSMDQLGRLPLRAYSIDKYAFQKKKTTDFESTVVCSVVLCLTKENLAAYNRPEPENY